MTQPHEVTREGFRWLPVVILGCIALAGLIVAGAHFGWWLGGQNAQHSFENTQKGGSYQTSWLTKVDNDWGSLQTDQSTLDQNPGDTALVATIRSDANTVCFDYSKLDLGGAITGEVSSDITTFVTANCSGPALSPSSGLEK